MNQGPLVSVIIPTYNYASFIESTLRSLREQVFTDWECIVVDDGSTDDTAQIVGELAEADPRLRYYRQENRRQAAAKNTGIEHSLGRYIQFLDADDLLEPAKIGQQVAYLETHPDVDIVYGGVRYFETERSDERRLSMAVVDRPWMPEVSGRGEEVLETLVRLNIMAINSALVRKSVVDDVGPFDEQLPPLEDWEFWVRCAARGKVFAYADLPGTLALVRSHPQSSSKNAVHMLEQNLAARSKFAEYLENYIDLNKLIYNKTEAWLGIEMMRTGDLRGGIRRFRSGWAAGRGTKWKTRMAINAILALLLDQKTFGRVPSRKITALPSLLLGFRSPGERRTVRGRLGSGDVRSGQGA